MDNDTWLDILVANGHVYPQIDTLETGPRFREPLLLHRNNRDGTFDEVSRESGLASLPLHSRRGAAFGDVFNTGNIDVLLLNVGEPPSLLKNKNASGYHRVLFKLIGTKSNRAAIGARVTIRAAGVKQFSEVRGGASYLSQNDLRLRFGLGTAKKMETVEIRWASGKVETLGNVAGDFTEADRHCNRTIALALAQLANLPVPESRFDEATRELDEALKSAPADPDIAVDAAIAWFRAGDVKKARQLAQSVVADNPRHARAQNVLGRIDLYRGDFEAAIRDLQVSVALDDDFETSYFLGISFLKAKRFADAQQWFQRLQGTMGDSAALHVLIGRAYSIGHFPESAVAEFRKAVQLDPQYPNAHGLLGYSMLEFRGEEAYPQARQEFERELKLHPDNYYALLLLGISAVALRDFPAAEAALLHAKRLHPEESSAYLYLGETYSETKRFPLAIDALEKYIRLLQNPEEVPRDVSRAYYLLGQDLRRLGRLEEAQKALANSQRFREANFRYDVQHIFDEPAAPSDVDSHTSDRIPVLLESGARDRQKSTEAMMQGGVPENPAVQRPPAAQQAVESKAAKDYRAFVAEILASSYNDLGVMRAKASNFVDASGYFKHAAAWQPTLPALDRNLGLAVYRAQLYSEAIPPLERHLATSSDDDFVRQLLGLSYFLTDNFAKTAEVLRPFLKVLPDDPGLLFAWGTPLVRTRRSEIARGIFRRLLEQNANNPAVHLLLGQAYAQQEDFAGCLTELKTALQLDPRLPQAHFCMGFIHLPQGDFESAAAEFRSELELRTADPGTRYHLGYTLLMH